MKDLLKRTFENRFNEGNYKELTVNLFNRFDFSREQTLKNQFNAIEKQALEDFTYLGTYEDIEKKRLDILIVELKSGSKVERARSLQRNLIGKYLKGNLSDAALVAFYSKDNPDWRLSFVKIDYRLDENGIKVELGTPPKRYSFLVGKTEPSHTAQRQLLPMLDDRVIPTLEDIEKAFSIEKVTKEFYNQIALMFTRLVGGERKIGSKTVQEAGVLKYPQTSDTGRKELAVRLIGRLLFCWFLKKKRSENGEPLIPSAILSSDAISAYPYYYHSLLEPLFFQVLNTPMDKRREEFRDDPWNKIPFLNGGLFEPHHHDFYEIDPLGTSRYLNILKVPDDWLSELFRIFEEYNFTIDESTTIDIEISVDPEMLGRIFENLLAEINPDTGETARKSTGSYYTPRPIVEYMVDESLKQYLKASLTSISTPSPLAGEGRGEGDSLDTKFSRLLSYADLEIDLTESEKDYIIDALDRVKIIDPACGSGAFPMGILHKMLLILQKIDPQSKKWLSRKLTRIDNKLLRHEIEAKLKRENWDYVHKLGIIQSSIYGVDIQPIAVEISKLRFFLSLVVDETIDDSKPNRGIVPLPNLEFKFVAANSLIGLPKLWEQVKQKEKGQKQKHEQKTMFEAHHEIDRLKELRDAYFSSFGDDKRRIEKEFKDTQDRMFHHALSWKTISSQTYKLSEWNPFSEEPASWFDPEWMFGIRTSPLFEKGGQGGFDIVIANPPYVRHESIKEVKPQLSKEFGDFYCSTADIYTYFYKKGIDLLKSGGHLCFIAPNKFMRAGYGKNIRVLLTTETTPNLIVDFCELPVFEAGTDPAVILVQKNRPSLSDKFAAAIIKTVKEIDKVNEVVRQRGFIMQISNLSVNGWTLESQNVLSVMEKLSKDSMPLGEYVHGRFYYGIKTGLNKAFVIDAAASEKLIKEDSKSKEIIKPWLDGHDILKWKGSWDGWYVIAIASSANHTWPWSNEMSESKAEKVFSHTFPAIHKHLSQWEDRLRKRDDQGRFWWELRSCSYYNEFEKPKIIFNETSKELHAYIDYSKVLINKTGFIIISPDNEYLVGILNSRLMDYYFRHNFPAWGDPWKGGRIQFRKDRMVLVPVASASDKQKKTIIERVQTILANPDSPDVPKIEAELDKLVYALYNLTPEEIKIVEGRV